MILGILFSSVILVLLAGFLWLVMMRHRKRTNHYIQEREDMQEQFEKLLLQSKVDVQEQTFTVLGQELHDNVGQLLSSTKMLLGATQRSLPMPPENLLLAIETLSKAIHDVRTLSKSLNREWLQQFNLVENLTREKERINAAHDVTVSFTASETYLPLGNDQQLLLFRTIQEALQNSLKHAKAKSISIKICCLETIEVRVKDDGVGINMEEMPKTGTGILNMKSRIGLLGGSINWLLGEEQGTETVIILPISKEYL